MNGPDAGIYEVHDRLKKSIVDLEDLEVFDVGDDCDEKALYAKCGMRMLFLTQDRDDIIHAVRRISTKVSQPNKESMARLKRLGRYLAGKRRMCFLLPVEGQLDELVGYSDSDWAQNQRRANQLVAGSSCSADADRGATLEDKMFWRQAVAWRNFSVREV